MAKRRVQGGRPERQFWEQVMDNEMAAMQYYRRLTELSISMFDWKNLPDSVDVRFMELALFADGKAIFFKDDVLGYLCLRCMNSGMVDIYDVPVERVAFAANGYNLRLDKDDSVIIYNNYLHTNSALDVVVFSKRLYDLDIAIDVNAKAQKTPVLVSCEENQRLTLKNLYMKYAGNEPVIYGDKGVRPDALKVLKTDAPYVADKLYQLKTQIWNEALTYLGISNVNITKKERLITDEVMRNQGGTIASRYGRLEMRRQAADKINKMFGLNIEVDYREDYRETDGALVLTGDTEEGVTKAMLADSPAKANAPA